MSLDALRGFDMLFIVGADALGRALAGLEGGPLIRFLAWQMEHAEWEGFRVYDLVFPLFVFVMGAAIPLSLDRMVAREGRGAAHRRVLVRGSVLYALGVIYYGGITEGWDNVRLVGVLQRLGFCYVATSLLYLHLRVRGLAVTTIALLVGYWALLTFVPVPGVGAGDFSRGRNLANWIDAHFLPLKVWYGDYDPEGLLSTLPSVASCLLGLFAGLWLRDPRRVGGRKVLCLAAAGAIAIGLGYGWALHFPVVKRIWTSSYVLVAAGWSALLLAGFSWAIDVRGWQRWAQPLLWVGTNALTIYLVSRFVDFDAIALIFLGGEIAAALNALWPGLAALVQALFGIVLCVLLCGFLFRRKIFLRL
ncbi:MAG TPA: DUF5009 domain-containing protein [Opitutus sp.]|nr:DUF5009 domain-containing protein [Opitutus sp.]